MSKPKPLPTEFSVPWHYWLCIVVFLGFSVGAVFLAISDDKDDRITGVMCGTIFGTFSILGILFPVLRKRESRTIRTERVGAAGKNYNAVWFPASRVKQQITLIGSLCFTVAGFGIAWNGDTAEHRVKGAIIGVAMAVVFLIALKEFIQGRTFGIILTPEGIIWRQWFRAPYSIRWDNIDQAFFCFTNEKYQDNIPTFAINVKDTAAVETTKHSREKLVTARKREGLHLHFSAETLLVPLRVVESAVQFYLQNPDHRSELSKPEGKARVDQMHRVLKDFKLTT